VEPLERTDIYAKAAGYVSQVNVDIGDRVKQGQVLAQLWIPEMDQERLQKASLVDDARAAVEQARAHISSAKAAVAAAEAKLAVTRAMIAKHEAEVAYRRADHNRIAKMVASQSMTEAVLEEKVHQWRSSESALEAAQAKVQSAQADVKVEQAGEQQAVADLARAEALLKVAEANLKQTEIQMEYAKIIAPYDGLITHRVVDSGDFIRSAADSMTEPLFTVDRDDRLRIVFDVPESQSSQVHVDQPASLVVDALKGRTFEGRVTRTTGALDPRTRTLRSEMELDGANTGLRPGMYGMITVVLADRPQAVLVPTQSLRYDDGTPCLYCASNGIVEKRKVTVGFADSNRTEILQGIGPNDLVVLDSTVSIQPGDSVRVARTP
jgi:RND family efflux transporter MFP subunit